MENGHISFWMQSLGATSPTRAPLDGRVEADVCIVGGGYTGLWAAYYLATQSPNLNVVVLEREFVGYGASGRNAGWISALMSANRKKLADFVGSTEPVIAFQRVMVDAVDEILAVLDTEGIDADQAKGGHMRVGRTNAAIARLRASREADLRWGLTEEEVWPLDAEEAAGIIAVDGNRGGLMNSTTAKMNPGKFVTGLARAVEKHGVTIYEGTTATDIAAHVVHTDHGTVRAKTVLLCTEGYSEGVSGSPRRRLAPVNSSIVVTEPLDDDQWKAIGWKHDECFGDAAHVFTYAQRSADGRIVIGGRGNPYRFGSATGGEGAVDGATVELLTDRLRNYFPVISDLPMAHAWSGVLGVTRDWCGFVEHDPATGLGAAGGYAGHGVTSSYVAARTLVDHVLGLDTKYARTPWFGYHSRSWEFEPVRWIGIHGMYRLFDVADRFEERRAAEHTSAIARFGASLAGLND